MLHKYYPNIPRPRYREWIHAGYRSEWDALEKEATNQLKLDTAGLNVQYKTGVYTPDQFENDVRELITEPEKTDLIIIDHLHHFFLEGDEIEALKKLIHQIKRMKEEIECPIVVLAQLRKDVALSGKRTLPRYEDIRGTASLTDVATDVIVISPVSDEKKEDLPPNKIMPMYFHIAKSRTAPEAREYAGIVCFDSSEGRYQNEYYLSKVKMYEDPEIVCSNERVSWATRAKYPTKTFTDIRQIKNQKRNITGEKDD